jgi:hypothetical protein
VISPDQVPVKLGPVGVGALGPEDDRSVEHAAANSAAAMNAKRPVRMTTSDGRDVAARALRSRVVVRSTRA